MKILKFITAVFAAIVSFTSCENKEIEIQDSFPFEAIVSGETKGLLPNGLETEIKLIPIREIENIEYFVSYTTSKDGVYEFRGAEIPTDTEIKLSSFEETIIYKPREAGKHIVSLNFRDSKGNTGTDNIDYEITEGDIINFTAGVQKETIDPGEKAIVNLEINVEENGIVAQDLTFSLIFENTTSNDPITISGQTLNSGDRLENLGATILFAEYQPTNSGKTDVLKFTLESSNGKKISQEVTITTNETDFDFSFTPSVNESIIGREVSVAFEITQTTNEALTYNVKVSGKQGLLFDEKVGTQFLPIEITNIESGSRSMRFNATAVDANDLIVEVTASNGVKKSSTINFNALPISFDFDINPSVIRIRNSSSGTKLNEIVSIILNRPSNLSFVQTEYSMTILSEVGSFAINGINGNHTPGDNIRLPETSISNNEFSGDFRFPPTINQSGKITVIIRNDTGFEVRKTVNIDVDTN